MRPARLRNAFLAACARDGLSEHLSEVVYDYLVNEAGFDKPIQPSDDLADVHGFVDEDVDDAIEDICESLSLGYPTTEDLAGGPVLRTVADLILTFDHLAVVRAGTLPAPFVRPPLKLGIRFSLLLVLAVLLVFVLWRWGRLHGREVPREIVAPATGR